MSFSVVMYADMFANYGKGRRLSYLYQYFNERQGQVDFYCRGNVSTKGDDRVKTFPLGGKPLRAMSYLNNRLLKFPDHSFLGRNRQEDLFDLWCAKANNSEFGFVVPGLHRTVKQLMQRKGALLQGVVCAPSFVRAKAADIQQTAQLFSLANNVQYMLGEADRVEKALECGADILCSSKAVADTYTNSGDLAKANVFWLQDWLQFTQDKQQVKKVGPLKFGYAGQLTLLKGIHILLDVFSSELKDFELHLYGEVDVAVKLFLLKVTQSNSNIIFHGYSSLSQIADNIDVLLVPSFVDAEPRVIREFLAKGNTVIAPKHITALTSHNLVTYTVDKIEDYKEKLLSAIGSVLDGETGENQQVALQSPSIDFNLELCNFLESRAKKLELLC